MSRDEGRHLLLTIEAEACRRLEYELQQCRASRDRYALQMIEDGHTWREVAEIAGFANTYIAELKRKALAGDGE